MHQITLQLQYPWPPMIPEEEEVSFILSGEYPVSSSEAAGEVVRKLISAGDPGFVLDSKGSAWPFYRETVKRVVVVPSP